MTDILDVKIIYLQAKWEGKDPYQAVADALDVSRQEAKILCLGIDYKVNPEKLKDKLK